MIAPNPKDHVDVNLLTKSLIYEGFKYSRNDIRFKGEGLLADYKCGFYSGTKCKGRVVATIEEEMMERDAGDDERVTKKLRIELRQGHTCNKSLDSDLNVVSPVVNSVIDATVEMRTLISQKSLVDVRKSSKEISQEVYKIVANKYSGLAYTGLSLNQMESQVFRERGKEFQNWEAAIRSPPLVNCSDSCKQKFLQFDLIFNLEEESSRIIGWAHHIFIHLLKQGDKHIFVDCTFDCVPHRMDSNN